MQDALLRVGDISFKARARQFAIAANRFAWDAQPATERRRSGLHFEHVTRAQRKGFHNTSADSILSLLSVAFKENNAPSGVVTLTFSANHTILLDVEYLDCAMRDLGPAWRSEHTPSHE